MPLISSAVKYIMLPFNSSAFLPQYYVYKLFFNFFWCPSWTHLQQIPHPPIYEPVLQINVGVRSSFFQSTYMIQGGGYRYCCHCVSISLSIPITPILSSVMSFWYRIRITSGDLPGRPSTSPQRIPFNCSLSQSSSTLS